MSQKHRNAPSVSRRTLLKTATASVGALALPPAVLAQPEAPYPSQPIKLLLTTPAGGINDLTFRKIAERFRALTGQQMIVDNRPGRGVASAALLNAPADGYTLGLLGRGHIALKHVLDGKLPYDPIKDFTWVVNLISSWFGLFVRADSPYKTLADLVAAAKRRPGQVKYGSAFGQGGVANVAMEELGRLAGVEMLHIPFRGDTDAIMQLVRGELDAIVAAGTAMPQVKEGRMRLLAWLAPERHPQLKDVPTFRDFGYPVTIEGPISLGAPKGMPADRVAYIEATMKRVLADPEVREFLDANYQRIDYRTSAELTAWARKQDPLEAEIVKRYGLVSR